MNRILLTLTALLLASLATLHAAASEDSVLLNQSAFGAAIPMAGAAQAAGSEALPIPPGLEVGQLPLRFREPVKADAPEKIVADVWQRSRKIRSQNLAAYLKQKPEKVAAGPWRFAWWLSALHQQYRLPEANAYMRENMARETAAYVYLMFGPEGKYPNRLEPQTLSILKEHMWTDINTWLDPAGKFQTMASSVPGTKYDIFPLQWGRMWGNENHEVRRKPPTYLALSILASDPAYASRQIGGKTVAQWLPIMQAHVKDIIRERALYGLWAEPGSSVVRPTLLYIWRFYP